MADTRVEHTQQQTTSSTDQAAKKCKHSYDVHFRNFTSKMTTRVVLHVPGSESSKLCSLCEEAGYLCETSSDPEQTLSLLQDVLFQNILVVSVHSSLDKAVLSLLRSIQTKDLHFSIAVIALVLSSSKSQLSSHKESMLLLDTLLQHGVSRIVNHAEVGHRLLMEIKLAEKSELLNNKNALFSRALLEAVENCHDAVQITGKDSCILYVNKAFVDLNGFSHDECIGKPAMSVLQLENWGSTWLQDNGTTSLLDRKERWEGACVARRRSGSAIKHYFKLLPITTTSSQLTHYVMIQRLLSPHEHIISPSQRHNSVTDPAFPLVKKSSSGNFPRMSTLSEAPLVKAVAMIAAAREDPACSIEMRESLDKCMEYLRFEELYTPFTHLPSGRNTGIVEGLLYPTRRFSLASEYQRGMAQHSSTHAIRHHPYDTPPAIKECISNLASWDFNILKLETTSNYEPLYYLGMEIFDEFEVADTLDIDLSVVASWLKMMERNYHRSNAYHNSTHAADVLQATAYLIRIFQANYGPEHPDHMEPLEIAALLITAVIHDLDHPGRTNPFLYNTSNEKSILYNDRAVLENHHVAFSFKLTLQSRQVNLYQSLPRATYQSIRSSIIDLVLATDMSKHFEHLSKFNTTLPPHSRPFPPLGGARPPVDSPVEGSNPPVPGIQPPEGGANPPEGGANLPVGESNPPVEKVIPPADDTPAAVSGDKPQGTNDDGSVSATSLIVVPNIGSTSSLAVSRDGREGREGRILAKRILVKCADIANACRPRELCKAWAGRISEEYFAQTEEEKRLNLPIVFPDFDRLTCKLPMTQVKFIEFFVHELFHAWNCYCNIDELINNMDDNYNYWAIMNGPSSDSEGEQDSTAREKTTGQQTTEITKK